MSRLPLLRLLTVFAVAVSCGSANAQVVPHTATYTLDLKDATEELAGAAARISVEIGRNECGEWFYDHRFAVRFLYSEGDLLTDQRSSAIESADGRSFEFGTTTGFDGALGAMVSGLATTQGGETTVRLSAPEELEVVIPAAAFPIAHSNSLIEAGRAGRSILSESVYDGDPAPQKELSSTSIITALPAEDDPKEAKARGEEDPARPLAGLQRWRVSEAFYDVESGPDGFPVFQTVYTLFENGVTDDIVLVFEGYTLEGELATLELPDAPACTESDEPGRGQ